MANTQTGLFGKGIYGQDVPRQTYQGKDLYADQTMAPDNQYNNAPADYAAYDQSIMDELGSSRSQGGSVGGSGGGTSTGRKILGGAFGAANLAGLGKDLGLFGGGAAGASGGAATGGAAATMPPAYAGSGATPAASGGGLLSGFGTGGASGGAVLGGAAALGLPLFMGLSGPAQPSPNRWENERGEQLLADFMAPKYAAAGGKDAYDEMVWNMAPPLTPEEKFRASYQGGDIDEYMDQNYFGPRD